MLSTISLLSDIAVLVAAMPLRRAMSSKEWCTAQYTTLHMILVVGSTFLFCRPDQGLMCPNSAMQDWNAVLLLISCLVHGCNKGRPASAACPKACPGSSSSSSRALWKLARHASSCQVSCCSATLICLAHGWQFGSQCTITLHISAGCQGHLA